ncbi:sigma-70 family RNA polymerase sigma factor [Sphingomonas glaciei]|uniref:Sigma-70 family RNA polymerase sigma factor n=1 Tax=Sphingomonas glaciei TaxID=2938948 RepID=A0ABY5MSI0_9SPHN|nr:sigma-70 family RNA polymerase sigma factor [Sphingomonas glaciei]UUR06899.1 sigma-70 family RNA polymerase sigma factor [Sphingomonas glaciei]
MSKITAALEAAVSEIKQLQAGTDGRPTARQRRDGDLAFCRLLKLLSPRFRHFIRQYGLGAHWDDAEQCCAIAVHRAIEAYDPEKAQFTTFVNWQIRGELQSLRFRVMTDQRPSAQKVSATTVSLHNVTASADGEEVSLEALIEDEDALARTEASASDYLARAAAQCLIDEFVNKGRHAALEGLRRKQPKRELAKALKAGGKAGLDEEAVDAIEARLTRDREILSARVFGELADYDAPEGSGLSREQVRQIGKRAARVMAELAEVNPNFRIMAEYGPTIASRRARSEEPVGLLPGTASAGGTRVVRIDAIDAAPAASESPSANPRRGRGRLAA